MTARQERQAREKKPRKWVWLPADEGELDEGVTVMANPPRHYATMAEMWIGEAKLLAEEERAKGAK